MVDELIPSPGTVTITNGEPTIAGTGTGFSYLSKGALIVVETGEMVVLGANPTSDTSAALAVQYEGTTRTGVEYQVVAVDDPAQIAGVINIYNSLLQSSDAVGVAFGWAFSAATADADPGSGLLRLNNATPSSVTEIYLDDLTISGNDVSAFVDLLASGYVILRSTVRPNVFAIYSISAVADSTGYRTLTVSHLASNGTFNANEKLIFIPSPAGPQGTAGADGDDAYVYIAYASDASGTDFTITFDATLNYIAILATDTEIVSPAVGDFSGLWKQYKGVPVGHRLTMDDSVADEDTGAGTLHFDNATFGSITKMYVDAVDADALDISALVESFDDVVNATSRGRVTLQGELDTAVKIVVDVTGTVIDKTGYYEIPVTPISGAIPSDADDLVISFSASGTDGSDGSDGGGLKGISVRAASTTNIDLSTDLEAGDTAGGVTLAAGNAFGAFGQTDASENGIYVVQASGAAVRHTNFDTWDEIAGGVFAVREGDFAGSTFINADAGGAGTIDVDDLAFIQQSGASALSSTCDGRLTLTSGTAVTTSDVTAAGTVYFTPHKGNQISLYNGADWTPHTLTEISVALSGGTASKPHDIFVYDNSGTLTLDLVAWTDGTTRATAIAYQDGTPVKTGFTTHKYVGTIYLDASKQAEDSLAVRGVWNMYNRALRAMRKTDATSTWTYSTDSYRQAHGVSTNRLRMVRGLNEDAVHVDVNSNVASSTSTKRACFVAVGINSTSVPSGLPGRQSVDDTTYWPLIGRYNGLPGLGLIDANWLERGAGSDTQTWESGAYDVTGIEGLILA